MCIYIYICIYCYVPLIEFDMFFSETNWGSRTCFVPYYHMQAVSCSVHFLTRASAHVKSCARNSSTWVETFMPRWSKMAALKPLTISTCHEFDLHLAAFALQGTIPKLTLRTLRQIHLQFPCTIQLRLILPSHRFAEQMSKCTPSARVADFLCLIYRVTFTISEHSIYPRYHFDTLDMFSL